MRQALISAAGPLDRSVSEDREPDDRFHLFALEAGPSRDRFRNRLGYAAAHPRRGPTPISTALSSTLMIRSFPDTPLSNERRAMPRPPIERGGAGFPALISHHRAGAAVPRFAANC